MTWLIREILTWLLGPIESLTREQAAQEILERDITFRYRPVIVEFDRQASCLTDAGE